jgi:hypothetical protein
MRRTFSKTKSFSNLSSAELSELVDAFSEYPEVLFDLFWTVSEGQPPGWIPLLERIASRFKEARLKEVAEELAQLTERISTLTAATRPIASTSPSPPQPPTSPSRTPPPPQPQPQPQPQPKAPPAPTPSSSWIDTAGQIRNAKVERDIRPEEYSTEEWAKQSPLALLGYHVGLGTV